MRIAYLLIWLPIAAFTGFAVYAAQDPWALVVGIYPAIFGWRVTRRFRDISESALHHRAEPDWSAAAPEAANLAEPPRRT